MNGEIYYNEINPYAAQWLRNLQEAGHLPKGTVDERSILEVQADDVPDTAHFFAGIGGWSYALRLAGWPDDWPVWTGSCPCQPFSSAGRAGGVGDERHLWPAFRNLIAQRRPPVVFGEQVASKLGRAWLAGVRADLERMGYAVGGADLPAAGVGAPHIRQRLFWVAVANGQSSEWGAGGILGPQAEIRSAWKQDGHLDDGPEHGGEACGLSIAQGELLNGIRQPWRGRNESENGGESGRMVNPAGARHPQARSGKPQEPQGRKLLSGVGCERGFWSKFDVLEFADGKARRIEPGTFPLAHGVPARVGKLRAYGNAIVPQVGEKFITAAMQIMNKL